VKKNSIKNEDPSINFKLPQELRAQVEKEAKLANSTVSNYLRNHLADFYSGNLYDNKFSFNLSHDVINSAEFLQLLVWIFSKRRNEKCIATNDQLNRYIRTIKKLEGILPDSLVIEFDKVLMDLIRVQSDTSSSRVFIFCGQSTAPRFDYEKLENFVLNEMISYYATKI
jgi:hypothetical protein